jgi:hypothetical protein
MIGKTWSLNETVQVEHHLDRVAMIGCLHILGTYNALPCHVVKNMTSSASD